MAADIPILARIGEHGFSLMRAPTSRIDDELHGVRDA